MVEKIFFRWIRQTVSHSCAFLFLQFHFATLSWTQHISTGIVTQSASWKREKRKKKKLDFFFFDCLASVSFLAMATRKCFRAKDCSWPWTGSGTKACGTSLCSSHCGGRSSRDPKHSLQVRARDGAEVASLWRGVTSDKGTTNCETSCVVVVVL